jgi:hypothetical protein
VNRAQWFLPLLLISALHAQVPSNASLKGKYWFRQLQLNADASQVQAIAGSVTFDGVGTFTYSGTQNIGATTSTTVAGSGTYTVTSNGFVTFTKPQDPTLTLNARLGAELLVASTTEGQSNEFDMLIAIPAPATTLSNATLNGVYQVGTLEFPGGNAASARSTAFNVTADGKGGLGSPNVIGHAVNLGGGSTSQTIASATYTVNPDGSGTANFGASSVSQLVSGMKTIFVSADGNYMIGGSIAAGGLDMIFGTMAIASASALDTSISGLYFTNGLAYVTGTGGGPAAYAGSDNSAGSGTFLFDRRYHAPALSRPRRKCGLHRCERVRCEPGWYRHGGIRPVGGWRGGRGVFQRVLWGYDDVHL